MGRFQKTLDTERQNNPTAAGNVQQSLSIVFSGNCFNSAVGENICEMLACPRVPFHPPFSSSPAALPASLPCSFLFSYIHCHSLRTVRRRGHIFSLHNFTGNSVTFYAPEGEREKKKEERKMVDGDKAFSFPLFYEFIRYPSSS